MKTKKITFIDILIIVVIIGAVIFATQFFRPDKSRLNGSVEFVVLVDEHENGILDTAAAGDIVVIDYTDKYKAEIIDIKTKDSSITTLDNKSNKYIIQTSPLSQDSYITVKADAEIGENVIKIGSTPIRVGQPIPIRGKGYTTKGYIINILNENTEQEG